MADDDYATDITRKIFAILQNNLDREDSGSNFPLNMKQIMVKQKTDDAL